MALALLWCSSLVAGDIGRLQQLADDKRFFELRRDLQQPDWTDADCGRCSEDGVAQRRAAEAYREKNAEAVRLRSAGASLAKIAEQLNTKAAHVRGWVEKGAKDAKPETPANEDSI